MQYTLFIGEMLIDFIPNLAIPAGATGSPFYEPHPGGAVANAAVALTRLGRPARFLGKLSTDSFGRLLLRTLQENGVDTSAVALTTQGPTTLVLVALEPNGQREFTFYRQATADTLLAREDLVPQIWQDVAICHAGSVLLASEPARAATLEALDQARRRGLPVSFDVNARPALWRSEAHLRETLAEVIPRTDLLKFSAEEAHYLDPDLTEPPDPIDSPTLFALGQKLLARGPRLVVLTRGALGALLMTKQQRVAVATSTSQALDTTGAGDAFMGALLWLLLEHDWLTTARWTNLQANELREAGAFANRAASLSCTRYGGIASLPTLAELHSAM